MHVLEAAGSALRFAAIMGWDIFWGLNLGFLFSAVVELGVLLAVIIGWQFTLAELVGGPLMIALMVLLFRMLLRPAMVQRARRQAELGLLGSMEGHAGMATEEKSGTIRQRIVSKQGLTSISHYFVMNWQMLWKDIIGGLLIAGALDAWVPQSFWSRFSRLYVQSATCRWH